MIRTMLRNTAAYASSSCNSSAPMTVGCSVGEVEGLPLSMIADDSSRAPSINATVSFIVYRNREKKWIPMGVLVGYSHYCCGVYLCLCAALSTRSAIDD